MDRLSAAVVGCMALWALAGSPAHADQPPPALTVEGEASAEVAPDAARLDLGVVRQRPTAVAATADLAGIAQALTDAARAAGLPPEAISTAALELSPVYPDDTPPGTAPVARAFRASTTLRLLIRQAEKAGAIASALVDKGANTIEGLTYLATDADQRLDVLRAEAARDARRRAAIYAGALGLTLGPVLEVTPVGQDGPRPVAMPMAAARMAKPSLPTAPGTLTLHTAVSVRWAIAP